MKRRKQYTELIPDVSPLAVVGFVIIPFFLLFFTSPRRLGNYSDMHVRLPDAGSYPVCILMDGPVYTVFLDKTQRLYVLGEDETHQSKLMPMKSFQEFQHTIDSLKTSDDPYQRPSFIISADRATKMPVIQRLLDCFMANGIKHFTLRVNASPAKREAYWDQIESIKKQ